jgi:hypothetical protein
LLQEVENFLGSLMPEKEVSELSQLSFLCKRCAVLAQVEAKISECKQIHYSLGREFNSFGILFRISQNFFHAKQTIYTESKFAKGKTPKTGFWLKASSVKRNS